jgi:hypothetical protein
MFPRCLWQILFKNFNFFLIHGTYLNEIFPQQSFCLFTRQKVAKTLLFCSKFSVFLSCLSVFLSFFLVHLSIFLSCLSVYLSICPSFFLSKLVFILWMYVCFPAVLAVWYLIVFLICLSVFLCFSICLWVLQIDCVTTLACFWCPFTFSFSVFLCFICLCVF